GKTWRELCWGDPSEERGYVRWACGDAGGAGMKDLSDEQKEWLREEANKAKGQQAEAEDAARGQERLPLGEQGSEEAADKAWLVRQCIDRAKQPALTQSQHRRPPTRRGWPGSASTSPSTRRSHSRSRRTSSRWRRIRRSSRSTTCARRSRRPARRRACRSRSRPCRRSSRRCRSRRTTSLSTERTGCTIHP